MLRNTSRRLQSWSQTHVGQVKEQLLLARELVWRFDQAMETRELSADEAAFRKQLKLRILALASLERTIIRLRSRLLYLKDGDANTKLFHMQCSHRMRKKHITMLEYQGTVAIDQQDKAQALFCYFSEAIGSSAGTTAMVDLPSIGIEHMDLEHLEYPFSELEVWNTVKELPVDKSPGPDGFTAEFYRVAWGIIKQDIMKAFDYFYETNRGQLHKLNGALITLLPKKPDARSPADYRPISLIHSFAKLLAKVLANRLAPYLQQLVAINQSAFIKTRSIHDNFKLVELTAKTLHRHKRPSVLLKLDISKAFDTVEWPFLLQVLQAMGFGQRWRDWISALISTASTSILLNGEPGSKIFNRRGLRQGDPLSPMLFILIMEVLHRLFEAARQGNVMAQLPGHGIKHQCSIYADDVVLFITPSRQNLVSAREILDFFGKVSGLKTNLTKSQAIPIACTDEHKALITRLLPVPITQFPVTYLGIPLSIYPLRRGAFQPLLDRVTTAMPTWKASLMNKAGQLTTVKAVMSATGVHLMISLKIPEWVFQEIDKRRRGFLWAGKPQASEGQCMVPWPTACRPQELGGLGIPDMRLAAYALRLRWLWFQRMDVSKPWRDLDLAFGNDGVVAAMFQHSIDVEVGDGHLALFWKDRWNGENSPCVCARELCTKVRS